MALHIIFNVEAAKKQNVAGVLDLFQLFYVCAK